MIILLIKKANAKIQKITGLSQSTAQKYLQNIVNVHSTVSFAVYFAIPLKKAVAL